jgi:hypothetical protein
MTGVGAAFAAATKRASLRLLCGSSASWERSLRPRTSPSICHGRPDQQPDTCLLRALAHSSTSADRLATIGAVSWQFLNRAHTFPHPSGARAVTSQAEGAIVGSAYALDLHSEGGVEGRTIEPKAHAPAARAERLRRKFHPAPPTVPTAAPNHVHMV